MNRNEYLKTVCDQITTPGIRDAIEEELAAHLSDQKDAFIEDGMDEQEAEEASVLEMGDPVEVGTALNEIHKVKPAQKYIYTFLFLNLITVLFNVWEILHNKNIATATGTIVSVLCFLIPVISLYFFIINAKFETEELGKLFLVIGNLGLIFTCQALIHNFRGRGHVLQDPYFFHGTLLIFLGYVGILFHYRRREKGWLKCQILGICIIAITVLTTADLLFITEMSVIYGILYTSIYYKNWFPDAKRRTLISVWAPTAVSFAAIAYTCLPQWRSGTALDFEKLAKIPPSLGSPSSIENASDFSFLPSIIEKIGFAPVYFLLLAGILFLALLILYRRRLTNEWGKLVFLASILILTVMLLNGILAAAGALSGEMAFAPFLWKHTGNYNTTFTDHSQCVIYYAIAALLTRFTIRDPVTPLEIEAQKIRTRNLEHPTKPAR
ncbi:permease prefix domain 1-containing protein [Blautia schinkii]|nr:permease prefix domain 1-containing protein [Blautia schinkii]